MREIEFRGRAIANNKHDGIKVGDWVYGSFIQNTVDAPSIVWGDGEQMEVDINTIGQYTGLKDKNGATKIFEGDVISMWYAPLSSCKGYVHFIDGAFWFNTKEASPKEELLSALNGYGNYIEVIGNIYESPELLK